LGGARRGCVFRESTSVSKHLSSMQQEKYKTMHAHISTRTHIYISGHTHVREGRESESERAHAHTCKQANAYMPQVVEAGPRWRDGLGRYCWVWSASTWVEGGQAKVPHPPGETQFHEWGGCRKGL